MTGLTIMFFLLYETLRVEDQYFVTHFTVIPIFYTVTRRCRVSI